MSLNKSISGEISIVVFGNRKDFFFTKICIASIRYYYPDIEIMLVKDRLNGNYDTSVLRKTYNVKLLRLQKKYFGWGASKVFFMLKKDLPDKRYLILDSDIIFVGRVLDTIQHSAADMVVVPENKEPPFSLKDKQLYIDPDLVKKYYPDYEFPGFFFNSGQMLVRPGLLNDSLLAPVFDRQQFPYFKDWQVFQTVDQSLLNTVIPLLIKRKQISVSTEPFMRWSVSYFEDPIRDDHHLYADGKTALLVHYCGDVRTFELEKMKGKNVLTFFRDQYLQRLSRAGRWLDHRQDRMAGNQRSLDFNKWRNDKYLKLLQRLKPAPGEELF